MAGEGAGSGVTAADVSRWRRMADRDEIRQLAYRYAWGMDSRDLEVVVELFAPGPGSVTDQAFRRERLRRSLDRSMRTVGVTILFVGNHLIEFDAEDEAHGLVYCRGAVEALDGGRPGQMVEQAILYRDEYRRPAGEWRFRSRTHELWYGVETAEHPLDQRPAEWPTHHDGLGTVPYGEPSWQAFWADGPPGPGPAG
jgi:hypothetical protein